MTGIAPGTALMTYTVTNSNGCSASQTATVAVNAIPAVNDITGNLTVFQGSTTSWATPRQAAYGAAATRLSLP